MAGGVIFQSLWGIPFSVAVWVGYIALFGIAVETGVVMVVYLHEALDRRIASGVPLKRLGLPEEIAEAILFVASDKAAFITGQIIRVNGGKTAA